MHLVLSLRGCESILVITSLIKDRKIYFIIILSVVVVVVVVVTFVGTLCIT